MPRHEEVIPGLIVVALWLLFLAVWVAGAWNAKRNAMFASSRWAWFAGRLGFVVLVVLFIRLRLFRFSPFPRSTATDALGIALCAIGIGIAIWARWHLGRNWSVRPSLKEGHDLVTGGPYRFVRHPIYTGLILALLGTAIVTGLTSWIVFALLTAVFVARIPVEERIMMTAFPDTYPAYRRRTRALIPAIW